MKKLDDIDKILIVLGCGIVSMVLAAIWVVWELTKGGL